MSNNFLVLPRHVVYTLPDINYTARNGINTVGNMGASIVTTDTDSSDIDIVTAEFESGTQEFPKVARKYPTQQKDD